ncbi:MAG: SEC-C domain-containing protein, partial [Planctomycetales bacterium]|nr:SEC-C domain-containing protein [Planctomycetales bacterium]
MHQAIEAKEGVAIKAENQTLATITLQNFFKLYDKICGMTGTAMTEANEFWKIYQLDVVAIPTNRHMQRIEHPDVIYRTETEKYLAVADEIERAHKWDVLVMKNGDEYWGTIQKEEDDAVLFQAQGSKEKERIERSKLDSIEKKGRPVLVGTVSIEKSERLSSMLEKRGIPHQVLNAKHHRREAEIVAQAGRLGGVTIATNMAGRGTDIILGGNAETMAWAQLQDKYATRLDVPHEVWSSLVHEIETREQMKEQGAYVKSIGGLHVIGTERHDARRIDLQLRGRCGRQGDPGSSRFFLSLEDDLMRIFAGEWVKNILERLGMKEGERIESKMVTRRIEAAQKKVEERNFEIRKNLLEYDEVMDEQRKRVYGYRQRILDGVNCRLLIVDSVHDQVEHHLNTFLDRDYGVESFARWAGSKLSAQLTPKDFRGMDFEQADRYAKDEAERMAETQVIEAIDENLPGEEEESEWNWEALAKMANVRWGLSLRDRDLKKIGRDEVAEHLIAEASKAIHAIDLSEGAVFLEEDFGIRSVGAWAHSKFGFALELDELRGREAGELKKLVRQRAEAEYDNKEAEYPVMAGMYRYTQASQGSTHLDRDGLVAWARERFETELSVEDLKHKQREEVRELLVEHSRKHLDKANEKSATVRRKIDSLFRSAAGDETLAEVTGSDSELESLVDWIHDTLKLELSKREAARFDRETCERRLTGAVEDQFRPEIRRMERMLLLQIVDTAWKDHLLAMDHLRSSIGLAGYAQMDPKVEYKREGMRLFEQMWTSIAERVTDLIFRMESLNEDFVGSTWVETSARHEQAPAASDIAQQQRAAIDASQGNADAVIETIRHRGERVGRNEPCPCGSGKK